MMMLVPLFTFIIPFPDPDLFLPTHTARSFVCQFVSLAPIITHYDGDSEVCCDSKEVGHGLTGV